MSVVRGRTIATRRQLLVETTLVVFSVNVNQDTSGRITHLVNVCDFLLKTLGEYEGIGKEPSCPWFDDFT